MGTPTKRTRNKAMLIAGFSFYILFILFAVLDNRLSDSGWSSQPIVEDVFMLGLGICISVLCIGYTYYAWTLNAYDFLAWVTHQVSIGKKQVSNFNRAYNHWLFRIIAPMGSLFGIVLTGSEAFAIIQYLLK